MKEYVIQVLEKEKWKGPAIPFSYTSSFYYDTAVQKTGKGFEISIRKERFETPFTHRPDENQDRLYQDWWEKAQAYGIIEDGKLLAVIEVCPEEWSNRLMVTELFVDLRLRRQGYGKKLIDLAKELTVRNRYRALMLETQSCNVNAVDFYLHQGFTLIGFDSCCYTNRDLERGEVRLNMGWFPEVQLEQSGKKQDNMERENTP